MNTDLAILTAALPQAPERFGAFRIKCDGTPIVTADAALVLDALRGLPVQVGWVLHADMVEIVERPAGLRIPEKAPLQAELLLADGASWHLRHRGDGFFLIRRLIRVNAPSALGLVRRYLVRGREDLALNYEVGYEPRRHVTGEEVLRPTLARFVGFAAEEGED